MCLRDTTTATNKFTVAPRSVAALVPPPSSLQIQILCDQKMRRFLPTQTSLTDQKCTLRMHSKQIRPPLQTLSSAPKAHNVSMPATKDFMAHTTAANLSSTRDRPPVTTAIAASSPDNHHAQAPRHPASKSDALCEILDLLDGPLSFFLTFFSWLIFLVQLPKVAVRHRSSSINFGAQSAQAQCSKTICHCSSWHKQLITQLRRAALVDTVNIISTPTDKRTQQRLLTRPMELNMLTLALEETIVPHLSFPSSRNCSYALLRFLGSRSKTTKRECCG